MSISLSLEVIYSGLEINQLAWISSFIHLHLLADWAICARTAKMMSFALNIVCVSVVFFCLTKSYRKAFPLKWALRADVLLLWVHWLRKCESAQIVLLTYRLKPENLGPLTTLLLSFIFTFLSSSLRKHKTAWFICCLIYLCYLIWVYKTSIHTNAIHKRQQQNVRKKWRPMSSPR